MDFNLTEEQRMLKDTARDFLSSECPMAFVLKMEEDEEGCTPELWRKMAEMGWMGLIVPEGYGGVGMSLLDLIVMVEEMGRVCLPGPFFSTMVGAMGILEGGTEAQKKGLLPRIAGGEMKMALAHTEPVHTRYDPFLIETTAQAEGKDYSIQGTKLFVPDGRSADRFIVVARTTGEKRSKDGISLFCVDGKSPGIRLTPLKTFAGDKQYEVVFDRVKVSGEDLLGGLHQGGEVLERMLQKAMILKCAEMVGASQKVLDVSAQYAKEREQFGKPIGSFQAVQHHCANMLIGLEGGRYITYKVGWMLNNQIPCTREVASAKAWVSDAFKKTVALGHQIMGATGYIVEHEMPIYSRRAKIAETAFGDPNYCRQVVAGELGL